MTFAAPASRNAPCPCGSGRRYKDCHGALGAARPGSPATQQSGNDAGVQARRTLMQEALACQQAGDLAGAAAGYEAVLAQAPDEFDALHMLGVVHYQQHDFDRAETHLRAAIARNPHVEAAQRNLQLLLEARRLERAQDTLCRAVLPKLARLCAPPGAFATLARAADPIDLLADLRTARAPDALRHIRDGRLGPARLHAPVGIPAAGRTAAPPASMLDAAVTILYGVDTPLAAFGVPAAAAQRVIVVDRDAPAALHDRLRELSDEARTTVHVRYATQTLADALALPGGLLVDGAVG
jgi:tetratricopeptide (TPR) repeat protein